METSAEPLRAMIDTNIFDAILEAPTSVALLNDLTNRGKLVIMVTHVQADEIAAMSEVKREKREALQNLAAGLITTTLPTSGAIWGVTKWGQGTDELRIGDIMRSNPKDAQDALIAITAAAHADVLVTNEEALPRRIRAKGATLEVLNFAHFLERARAL
jgi:predicted nucleic acid-binding protein